MSPKVSSQRVPKSCADTATTKTVLFINDSYFAYRMLSAFLAAGEHHIPLAVVSKRTTGSIKQIAKIIRTATWRYVAYRGLLQLYSMSPLGRKKTAKTLLDQHKIPTMDSSDASNPLELDKIQELGAHVAVAFNFDQILKKSLLEVFQAGVMNAHASKLPFDRGISPALWAFARGDDEIWTSIYRMDEGLDTGPLIHQYPTTVHASDSAFSLYARICDKAGTELGRQLNRLAQNGGSLRPQQGDGNRKLSWPDREFGRMLRQNRRRLFRFRDFTALVQRDG